MLNIKHTYLLFCFQMTESKWLHFSVTEEIDIYLHNKFSGKKYVKSKLHLCLYIKFYQSQKTSSEEALSRGADWKLHEPMMAWPVMHEMEARQLQLAHFRHDSTMS